MRIDQYLPVFSAHDAIGAHVLQTRRLLRSAGVDSDIYAEVLDPRLGREARHYLEGPARPRADRLALYHVSTSSPMSEWLLGRARLGQRVMSCYHNITPSEYFRRWLPPVAGQMDQAREELAALAPHTELAVGVSRFNEEELRAVGYPHTTVAPLLVDLEAYHQAPDARTLAQLQGRRRGGGAAWLFVGRIAPNKCQHDVIAAFAVYRRLHDPRARLTLVGGGTAPSYRRALVRLVGDLGVAAAVDFVEGLTHHELLAHFATADVMVCCSEHEGFCVPVLEAMELGVPVVAYGAAALPETVGDAGVLLDDKDPLNVATAVADLLGDEDRRRSVIDAGRARAAHFALPEATRRWREVLAGVDGLPRTA